MMIIRMVDGFLHFVSKDSTRLGRTEIVVRVEKDARCASLSLADERLGVMLQVPLEPLKDILEVRVKNEEGTCDRT